MNQIGKSSRQEEIEIYQNKLIEKSLPLSERVVEAFYAYPRHLFVPEYDVEEAYEDRPLLIYNKPPFISTLSQPSFVLRILDMLDLHEGQQVFELGTGSGWNTSMLSWLVGTGHVVSCEIIPEMAGRARQTLDSFKIKNIKILAEDGFEGAQEKGPFDRIIFTAGSHEFPQKIFESLKEEGLMVFVHQREDRGDMLELIKKEKGRPEVRISIPCAFVPVIRNKEIRNKESRQQDGIL